MMQPKVGQKFRIKSLPNRVFKCVSDDGVKGTICESCCFDNDFICVNLECQKEKCHYVEVYNVKTKK